MSIGGWNYDLETGAEPPTPEEMQEEYEQELTQTVLDDIEGERIRQRQQWGNSHDDQHQPDDWADILDTLVDKACDQLGMKRRKYLVHLAATVVAHIEAMDRADAREQAEHASDEPPADWYEQQENHRCVVCNGRGMVDDVSKCDECDGTGTNPVYW